MKDIVITSKKIKRERNIYILSFVLVINMIAIIVYSRPWAELYSQIGYVFVISVFIYFVLWIPRLLFMAGEKLFKRTKPVR